MDAVRARAHAQDLVRDALGRSGRTVRDIEILVDWSHEDVVLRRAHIGHEWSGDRSLGQDLPVRTVLRADWDERRMQRAVTRFTDLAIALSDRQRAIEPHLDGDRHPAWSILVEPFALALLRDGGWGDRQILAFHHPASDRYTVGDGGYTLAPDLPTARRDGHAVAVDGLALSGGVVTARRIRFWSAGSPQTTYRGGPDPKVEIAMPALPETAREAMRGRRLSEIVDHPVIKASDAMVTSARHASVPGSEDTLTLRLSRRLVPMAPPPQGMDTNWLATIARR